MTPAWCLLAESASHTFYRFARLQSMSEWWHWLLLVLVCAGVFVYVVGMYWRDSAELSRGIGWSLTAPAAAGFRRDPVLLPGPGEADGRSRDQTIPHRTAGRHQPEHGSPRFRVGPEFVHIQPHRPGDCRVAGRRADQAIASSARRGRVPIRRADRTGTGGVLFPVRLAGDDRRSTAGNW